MDIVLAVFLWLAPLALLLALTGFLVRKAFGRLPGWFYPGALLLSVGIALWCQIWIMGQDGGLEILLALVVEVNAVVAAVLVAVAWVVSIVRARKSRERTARTPPGSGESTAEDQTSPRMNFSTSSLA